DLNNAIKRQLTAIQDRLKITLQKIRCAAIRFFLLLRKWVRAFFYSNMVGRRPLRPRPKSRARTGDAHRADLRAPSGPTRWVSIMSLRAWPPPSETRDRLDRHTLPVRADRRNDGGHTPTAARQRTMHGQ
ncbi:MAG: hypothetical protein V3R98_00245, partial [Alphaproteobacteria bacterium]